MSTLFSVEFENITKEHVYDLSYECFDTFEEALEYARNELKYFDKSDLIQATIFQEEHKKGDLVGEPFDIYAISNLNKKETMKIRTEKGYTRAEVDEYLV